MTSKELINILIDAPLDQRVFIFEENLEFSIKVRGTTDKAWYIEKDGIGEPPPKP